MRGLREFAEQQAESVAGGTARAVRDADPEHRGRADRRGAGPGRGEGRRRTSRRSRSATRCASCSPRRSRSSARRARGSCARRAELPVTRPASGFPEERAEPVPLFAMQGGPCRGTLPTSRESASPCWAPPSGALPSRRGSSPSTSTGRRAGWGARHPSASRDPYREVREREAEHRRHGLRRVHRQHTRLAGARAAPTEELLATGWRRRREDDRSSHCPCNQQAGGHAATSDGDAAGAGATALPNTGLSLAGAVIAGLGLVAAGVALRRRERHQRYASSGRHRLAVPSREG